MACFSNESFNINIGSSGNGGDMNVIRIGTPGTHNSTFISGINNQFLFGPTRLPVVVDASSGQLGFTISSRKYKDNVQDMNEDSSAVLDLRPVSFIYKKDSTRTKQYGLIAEEVDNVLPTLVVRDIDGEILTVQYEQLSSLLLNEVIKQHRIIEDMKVRLAALEAQA